MNKGRSWARTSNSFHGVFDDQSELVIAYGSRIGRTWSSGRQNSMGGAGPLFSAAGGQVHYKDECKRAVGATFANFKVIFVESSRDVKAHEFGKEVPPSTNASVARAFPRHSIRDRSSGRCRMSPLAECVCEPAVRTLGSRIFPSFPPSTTTPQQKGNPTPFLHGPSIFRLLLNPICRSVYDPLSIGP